jgi:hypothetical protein
MLEALVTQLRSAGIDFAFAEVRHTVNTTAHRSRLLERVGKDHVFDTVEAAVTALEQPAGTAARS